MTQQQTEKAALEEQVDLAIIKAEQKHKNPTIADIITELINNKVISDESRVNQETGTITTDLGYEITGKLDDYISKVSTGDNTTGGSTAEIPKTWELVKEIQSPNYPYPYPSYCNITYSDAFDEDIVGIKIVFKSFMFEIDEYGRYDRFTIYNKDKELAYVFSGRGNNKELYLQGNSYEMIFVTDYTSNYKGFDMEIYTTKSKELIDGKETKREYTARYFDHIEQNTEEVEVEFDSDVKGIDINIFNAAYKQINGENSTDENITTDIKVKIFDENGNLLCTKTDWLCKSVLINEHLENVGKKMKIVYERSSDSTIKSNACIIWQNITN